jgi:hypothetical protein
MDVAGEEDALGEAEIHQRGLVFVDLLGAAADDGEKRLGSLPQGEGDGAEEEVDALVDGEGADVEREDGAGGEAEAFAGLRERAGSGSTSEEGMSKMWWTGLPGAICGPARRARGRCR